MAANKSGKAASAPTSVKVYRLREGYKHFVQLLDDNGKYTGLVRMEPGEEIQLNDSQAYAWRDKFELVTDRAKAAKPE